MATDAHLVLTPLYSPPEIFVNFKKHESTDVYSFGCLMLHVMSGKRPWNSVPLQEMVTYIRNTKDNILENFLRTSPQTQLDNEIVMIIAKCVQLDCTQRISPDQL